MTMNEVLQENLKGKLIDLIGSYFEKGLSEEEINECDPLIQERLTSYVSQRRSDLTMASDTPWEIQQ